MKISIETYRDWEISFDTEKETFYAISDAYDHGGEKRSYASVKKYIDDYIKANQEFKPFVIEKKPEYGDLKNKITLKVVGMRKDGVFVTEIQNGERKQISTYDEKGWCVLNPDNATLYEKIAGINELMAPLSEKLDALTKERKSLSKEFVEGESLSEVRKRYTV